MGFHQVFWINQQTCRLQSIVFNRKLIYQRPSVCDLTKAPGVLSMSKPTRSYTLWSKKRHPPHSYPTRLLLVANIRRTSPKIDWVCSGWILVKLGIFMTRVDMAQTYQLHACAELAPRKYREPLYCIVIYCDPLLCWGHCCCKMYAYISSIVMTQHSIWIHGSHFSQLHCLQMAECLCSQITRVKARGPVGIWGWLAIKGTQACCNNYLEGWAKANFLEQTFGLWMKISDMGWASSSSFNKKRVPRLVAWSPWHPLTPRDLLLQGLPCKRCHCTKHYETSRGKKWPLTLDLPMKYCDVPWSCYFTRGSSVEICEFCLDPPALQTASWWKAGLHSSRNQAAKPSAVPIRSKCSWILFKLIQTVFFKLIQTVSKCSLYSRELFQCSWILQCSSVLKAWNHGHSWRESEWVGKNQDKLKHV